MDPRCPPGMDPITCATWIILNFGESPAPGSYPRGAVGPLGSGGQSYPPGGVRPAPIGSHIPPDYSPGEALRPGDIFRPIDFGPELTEPIILPVIKVSNVEPPVITGPPQVKPPVVTGPRRYPSPPSSGKFTKTKFGPLGPKIIPEGPHFTNPLLEPPPRAPLPTTGGPDMLGPYERGSVYRPTFNRFWNRGDFSGIGKPPVYPETVPEPVIIPEITADGIFGGIGKGAITVIIDYVLGGGAEKINQYLGDPIGWGPPDFPDRSIFPVPISNRIIAGMDNTIGAVNPLLTPEYTGGGLGEQPYAPGPSIVPPSGPPPNPYTTPTTLDTIGGLVDNFLNEVWPSINRGYSSPPVPGRITTGVYNRRPQGE